MNKAKDFLSKLVYNKFLWQLILAVFMIGMAIFFIKQEHIEVFKIEEQLASSKPVYIILGVILTFIYIAVQGLMYIYSFKALNKHLPFFLAINLFLKRNFVSVFLPAGGFSSLAFFTKDIENKGVTKSQIHLASTIFGFCSILSVVLVAIPVLGIALLFTKLDASELLGFIFLLLLTGFFIFLIYSISVKGLAYNWLSKAKPSLIAIMDEMLEEKINRKNFYLTLATSVLIELIGIAHLYICMLALGFDASLPAAIIGYIVMVILLIASPFLRGLGAIEISLTLVLQQFGFPIIAAATITLLFRFFEFWLPILAGILSFITKKDNILLRILPAFIILILGVVNIISAISPAIPSRLRLMKNLIPEDIIVTSNSLVLIFGLILVIISVFLLHGSKRAWYLALSLTLFSVIGHILKAADYEEAILAFVAAAILIYTKNSYKLKPHPKLTHFNIAIFLYAIIAFIAYGVLGFYFIDKRHFGVNFEVWDAFKAVLKLFFLFDDQSVTPLTKFGSLFIVSIYVAGGSVILFFIYSLLRPYFSKPYNSPEEFDEAKELLTKYGVSALDYFKTYPDKFLFFNDDRSAFISFKLTRHFAVVLENPVGKDDEAKMNMLVLFEAFCNENGFISTYYRVPHDSLHLYQLLKMKSIPIGEEAILDLETFKLEGGKMKTTRSAISRLTTEGYDFKVYNAPIEEELLQKLEKVSDNWLQELGKKEVAFTQGVFDTNILKNQTILTIENQEEKVFAFLNIVPDYAPNEATYDLIRKVDDAPNGILDMLLAKTFLYLQTEGFKSVNMGLAPMSGMGNINMTQKTIKYAYENLKAFGQFKGLRKYKEKFYPSWEKKYLIYSHNYHLFQVPSALKRVSEGT